MNDDQLNSLWSIRNRLDGVIWGYKYDLENAPELDDALRDILFRLTNVLSYIATDHKGASA